MRLFFLFSVIFCLVLQAGCSDSSQDAAQSGSNPASEAATAGETTPPGQPGSTDDAPAVPVDPGQAYLYINAQKPGVKVLPSGLQFEILASGDGSSPGPSSIVVTHYEGSLIDGTVFDSSIARNSPATFPVNGVIQGWTEALQMMKEGDRWRLVIPPDLAYGERGAGGGRIPANAVLVFEVQLIEIKEG